jgi:hypothetical protein
MTDTAPKPFDFREILSNTDSLGRHTRRFRKLTGRVSAPEFTLHKRAADYAIAQHCVGRASTPWAEAMQAYEPTELSGKEARRHWQLYLRNLDTLTHALANTYRDRAQSESEAADHHANIKRAWEKVGDEIEYFAATRHDLCISHPLPNRNAFSSAIEWFYEDAMATMQAPPESTRPKSPTKVGELRRGSATIRQLMEEAAAARRAEPRPPRKVLTARRPKPESERVRHAIAMVEDPTTGISWHVTLLNAINARGQQLETALSDELRMVLLSALDNAEEQLDHALTHYTSVLRHNFHHPEDARDDAAAFGALNESAQHLITQLPGDKDRLPNPSQFASLQEAMKNAALNALNAPDVGNESPSKRRGGGAGGFPGGRR